MVGMPPGTEQGTKPPTINRPLEQGTAEWPVILKPYHIPPMEREREAKPSACGNLLKDSVLVSKHSMPAVYSSVRSNNSADSGTTGDAGVVFENQFITVMCDDIAQRSFYDTIVLQCQPALPPDAAYLQRKAVILGGCAVTMQSSAYTTVRSCSRSSISGDLPSAIKLSTQCRRTSLNYARNLVATGTSCSDNKEVTPN